MLRRRTLLYSLAAVAAFPGDLEPFTTRHGRPRRVGASDVERVRTMTRMFGDADDLYGGGHARTAASAYLSQEVVPLLHGSSGRARPALFTAAGELAYLVAYMANDAGRAGLAQRYYVQAARLGDEAGDSTLRSYAFRSLAVQAVELGHGRQALDLAQAAQAELKTAPARTRAWLTGMCAEATAAATHTDRALALRLLGEAEADLERADSPPDAQLIGAYQRSAFAHQVALTLTQIGDHAGAEKHFAASISARLPREQQLRRTKALVVARLANAQLLQRKPEAAARTLLGEADGLDGIFSARLTSTLTTVRTGLRPYCTSTDTAIEQADHMLAQLLRNPSTV